MESINIFISSPGDVQQERYIAKKVIKDLSRTYSKDIKINAFMWEDMPLLATTSFQDGIDYILKQNTIDIAVFILWSRLGTKLGKEIVREDGSRYNSGTEYEYEIMKASFEKSGHPKIIAYVKTTPFKEALRGVTNPEDIKEALSQHDAVKQFIERSFHDKTNETTLANHSFATLEEFENQLRTHLKGLIQQTFSRPFDTIEWEGNPYVGLKTYLYEESDIYFGRSTLVNEISCEIIRNNTVGEKKTLLLLGESGSGKSSIVNAGILPFMLDGLSEKQGFEPVSITPSQFRGNVYQGLVSFIKNKFPFLEGNPVLLELENGIGDNYQFSHLQYALKSIEFIEKEPILIMDQFEELFCDPLISEENRQQFLHLLRGLSDSGCLWIIITMRSDFYNRFSTYPDLGSIKGHGIVFDMPGLTIEEITQIVEEPAKKANIFWEDDGHGNRLNKVIINEAFAIHDLPLIEFALAELYKRKDETNTITYKAYEEIGHLKGAIVKYADGIYNSLSDSQKTIFDEIISQVITCSPDNNKMFVRRIALLDDVAKTEIHTELLRKLVNAYLLKSDSDSHGNSTITISHEVLLTSWPILSKWLEAHRHFIKTNDYFETQAKHWNDFGKRKKDLITNEIDVNEADYFMYKWSHFTSNIVNAFLKASIKRNRKRWNFILSIIDILVCVGCTYLILINDDDTASHYFGEKALGIVTDILFFSAIGINFVYRNWCLDSYKWNKRIFCLWFFTILTWSLDFIMTISRLTPEESEFKWLLWLVVIILLLPTTFAFLNFLIVRNWTKGNNDKVFRDNIKSTKTKTAIRWILFPAIIIIGLFYLLIDSNEKQEKFEQALVISAETISALDAVNENFNENSAAYRTILDYECYVWDTLSKMLPADTLTIFDYNWAKTMNKTGYPEKAITRFDSKSRLDPSDLNLRAAINFKLNRQNDVIDYLNNFQFSDSTSDLWQLTRWATLLAIPQANVFMDSANTITPPTLQSDSIICQIIDAQIKLNNDSSVSAQYIEQIRSLYSINDSIIDDLRPFVSDYLWFQDAPSLNTSDLQTLLGNDYPELLTMSKDTVLGLSYRQPLTKNSWYTIIEELGAIYLTEFLPSDNVFRRKICTIDSEGDLNTHYITICSYRFKEQDNELLFEHYSFDTHIRLGFVVNTITNDSIVLEQRLPITRRGERMVLYKLEE